MEQQDNIIIVMPAHNEARTIRQVVETAARYLPVIVVDDGSTDETAALASAANARVISQHPNQGKGVALVTGFTTALAGDAQAIIMLDSDGQHDPEEIPRFIQAYQTSKADLIIGYRDFSKMPLVRRISNTTGTLLFSAAMGKKIRDNQSGYRLVSRKLAQLMVESSERGFEFEVEMIMACVKNQLLLEWVPIRTIYGDEKSHIRPLHHIHHFMRMVFKAWRARISG